MKREAARVAAFCENTLQPVKTLTAAFIATKCPQISRRASMEALHAKEVLQEALSRYGTPEIVNTDQGSQFTAQEFVDTVFDVGAKLSMDGRGALQSA